MGRGRKRKDQTEKSGSEEEKAAGSSQKLKGKSVLKPCSGSKENLKRQKKKQKSEDIKEMSKSIRELTEDFKKLKEVLLTKGNLYEEILLTKSDLHEETLLTKSDLHEEKETPEKKAVCCYDSEEALDNNSYTIFVKGFEYLRTREELKRLLGKFFGSCGEVASVYVPIECETRCPLGFAFINFVNRQSNEKALKLNGCALQGRQLEVTMAKSREEFYGFTNFMGCDRCIDGDLPRWR